jgi:hypothetical protein
MVLQRGHGVCAANVEVRRFETNPARISVSGTSSHHAHEVNRFDIVHLCVHYVALLYGFWACSSMIGLDYVCLAQEKETCAMLSQIWLESTTSSYYLVFLVLIILHSSYIAYGTSAIFSTTSMTYMHALAPVFYCTILLAVPTPSSRHGFWALCPPT